MKNYFINYHTGAGNFELEGTLDDAMKAAEESISFTQQNVSIELDGEVVAYLPWWGIQPKVQDVITCQFGNFGFYGEWIIEEQK